MADFCKQCTEDMFGEGIANDMSGITSQEDWDKGLAQCVICEGCGPIQVDPEGNCVSNDCMCAGQEGHGLPWKTQVLCTGHADYDPPCPECGQRGCNGECYGDDMMGASG